MHPLASLMHMDRHCAIRPIDQLGPPTGWLLHLVGLAPTLALM